MQYSITPLIWTLVIRISNNPDRLCPSVKHFRLVIALHFLWLKFPPIFTTRIWNYELYIFGAVVVNKGHRLISTGVKIVCPNACTLVGTVCVKVVGQQYN